MISNSCLLILTVLAFIYVVSFIYFELNARNISEKRYNESIKRDNENRKLNEKQADWENEVRALSLKIFELQNNVKEWQDAYNVVKTELDSYKISNKENEERD